MDSHTGVFGLSAPIVLDGGLSSWLGEQGYDLDSDLWSARLILESPEAIIQAHVDYLAAGARIITTASYQATLAGFIEFGLSTDEARHTILESVRLAITARERFLADNPDLQVHIAASIGPYGAYLADGSEYRGNYGVSEETLADFHQERLTLLSESDADILACETVPDYIEARVLNRLLMEQDKISWVSFSCKDGETIWDGTPIETAAELFNENPTVGGVGINCTAPRFIGSLIDRLKLACPGKAIIVYPNSGEVYDASTRTWNEGSSAGNFSSAAPDWHSRGADIIGGCCRVTPAHVKLISETLKTKAPD